jgi:hypothetical protein
MRLAPAIGLSTRFEPHWLDVRPSDDEVALDAAQVSAARSRSAAFMILFGRLGLSASTGAGSAVVSTALPSISLAWAGRRAMPSRHCGSIGLKLGMRHLP